MSAGPSLLRLVEVTKRFGGVTALDRVSLTLQPGEIHALVGENGAGKSTLVKLMTGVHRPDGGFVELEGQRIEAADPGLMRRRGVAPIYQQPALFPQLSVAENLAVGAGPRSAFARMDWRRRREEARAMLARVGAAIDVDTPAEALRMAEQQLVEIAKALGADARVLLMDEPTAVLDDRDAEHLFALIERVRRQGVGVIYISHRLHEIERLSDRVTVLRDGRHVATHARGEWDRDRLIRDMVGRPVREVFPKRAVAPGDTVLELTGVGCRGSGVHDVHLTVRSGEIVGLAGLVGAGRTELARVLFGLTPADAGLIRVAGRAVRIDRPAAAMALGLGYVPEDRRRHGVVPALSIVANTTLAVLPALTRHGLIDRARERAVAADLVARLDVRAASLDAEVATLSGGNQQKVALARWLAAAPRLLVLDEPTQGVDVGAKAEIHRLIGELASQGLGILMISSELPELLGMSDRVVVMRGGTVAGTLSGGEANEDRVLALAIGHIPGQGSFVTGDAFDGRPS